MDIQFLNLNLNIFTQLGILTLVSLIFRVLGVIVFTTTVIPRAWRESRVPNGIGFLRKMILIGILIYFLTQSVILFALFSNPVELDEIISAVSHGQYFQIVSIIQSFGFLLISIIFTFIYSHEYGEKITAPKEKISDCGGIVLKHKKKK